MIFDRNNDGVRCKAYGARMNPAHDTQRPASITRYSLHHGIQSC